MDVEAHLPYHFTVSSLWKQDVGVHRILHQEPKEPVNPLSVFRIQDWEEDFDPSVKIPFHKIHTPKIGPPPLSHAKNVDAAMFQKAADDAADPDSRNRRQAADSPDQ